MPSPTLVIYKGVYSALDTGNQGMYLQYSVKRQTQSWLMTEQLYVVFVCQIIQSLFDLAFFFFERSSYDTDIHAIRIEAIQQLNFVPIADNTVINRPHDTLYYVSIPIYTDVNLLLKEFYFLDNRYIF